MFLCINLPNLIELVSFVQYKCQYCHYLSAFLGVKFDFKILLCVKNYILQLYFVDGKHNSFDLSRNGQPLDNSLFGNKLQQMDEIYLIVAKLNK